MASKVKHPSPAKVSPGGLGQVHSAGVWLVLSPDLEFLFLVQERRKLL